VSDPERALWMGIRQGLLMIADVIERYLEARAWFAGQRIAELRKQAKATRKEC